MTHLDVVARARAIVELLDRADVDRLRRVRSADADWDVEAWVRGEWLPRLVELAGPDRRIVRAWQVSERVGRVLLEGAAPSGSGHEGAGGAAYVTVALDSEGGLGGILIAEDDRQGGVPRSVVVGCPGERREELRAFYAGLVRARLGFGEGIGVPPRWPDPAYPQQLHLDVLVADLERAERRAVEHGARRLRNFGDHRVLADPLGHPFCLYASTGPYASDNRRSEPRSDGPGVLLRIVLDCPEPDSLASFYQALLAIPCRVASSGDLVTIADRPDSLPRLGFQRVEEYRAPRWPDPAYPPQLHFDLFFDDREGIERRALSLGATRLPPQGGGCPVYADPAGHPFCLCGTGD